jgi:hypothetical protein
VRSTAAARASLTRFGAEELKDMAFDCVLMDDPVVAADGHTYNRTAIERWLKQHDTSPLTNEPLESKALFPNMGVRRQINAWREEHGLPALVIGQPAKAKAGGGGVAVDQIVKPAAVCEFSKKPLQGFCITCKRAICINCAMDASRCKPHDTRPLDSMVGSLRATHAAWEKLREGRPERLRAQCDSVAAAANATIDRFTRKVREEEAELVLQLQRSFLGDFDANIAQQVPSP